MTKEKFISRMKDDEFKAAFKEMIVMKDALYLEVTKNTPDTKKITLSEYLMVMRALTNNLVKDFETANRSYLDIVSKTKVSEGLKQVVAEGLSNIENIKNQAEFMNSELYEDMIEIAQIYEHKRIPM